VYCIYSSSACYIVFDFVISLVETASLNKPLNHSVFSVIFIVTYKEVFCKGVQYHHGILYSVVADGRDRIQMWRVFVSLWNNHSWQLTVGGCVAWGLGRG
jgi:hypothetical protein